MHSSVVIRAMARNLRLQSSGGLLHRRQLAQVARHVPALTAASRMPPPPQQQAPAAASPGDQQQRSSVASAAQAALAVPPSPKRPRDEQQAAKPLNNVHDAPLAPMVAQPQHASKGALPSAHTHERALAMALKSVVKVYATSCRSGGQGRGGGMPLATRAARLPYCSQHAGCPAPCAKCWQALMDQPASQDTSCIPWGPRPPKAPDAHSMARVRSPADNDMSCHPLSSTALLAARTTPRRGRCTHRPRAPPAAGWWGPSASVAS